MKITKKLLLTFMMIVLITIISPIGIVTAQSTTIEIASGDTIFLNVGESIPVLSFHIPVEIKNLPDMGSPENGLAAIEIGLKWDPAVIHVDAVIPDQNATADPQFEGLGWNIFYSNIDNEHGSVYITGYNLNYFDDNVIIGYFGITAVGKQGDTTQISIIHNILYDKFNVPIPATLVNTTVHIAGEKYITISPGDITIAANTTQQYTARIDYANGADEDITGKAAWSSSNEKVAIIQSTGEMNPGLAIGISEGITTLIAEYDGIRSSVMLTVTTPEQKTIPEEGNTEIPAAPDTPTGTDNVTQSEEDVNQETPVDGTGNEGISEPEDTLDTEPAGTEDDSDSEPGSGLPVVWIVGGIVAFAVVLGVLGYTFMTRRRF